MSPFFNPMVMNSHREYNITNAALFDGTTGFLSRTFGAPTSGTAWTVSFWCLRTKEGAYNDTWTGGVSTAQMYFHSNETIGWADSGTLITNGVYRDPSAWLHIVIQYDSAQATSSDRMSMWINGVKQSNFGTETYPTLNAVSNYNVASNIHRIGSSYYGSDNWFGGYMAELCFVDGLALDAAHFGETDTKTGNWIAKSPNVSAWGANGCYLDFSNGANLGEDQSGNANNWTVNGTITQVTSTPTNTGQSLNATLGTVTPKTDGTGAQYSYGTSSWANQGGVTNLVMHENTGLYKVKFVHTSATSGSSYPLIGIMSADGMRWHSTSGVAGWNLNNCVHFDPPYGGTTFISRMKNAVNVQGWGGSWSGNPVNGDEIEFLIDTDNDTLTVYNEDGTKITNAQTMGLDYPLVAACRAYNNSCDIIWDFTATEAAYNAEGTEWTTNRYPKQTDNVDNHFKTVLYTGDGTAIGSGGQSITDVGFQPDFTWIKNASNSSGYAHHVYDAVRGATKHLPTSGTDAEATATEGLDSFDSDGFTVGNHISTGGNGDTYVAWCANLPNTKISSWSGSPTITPSKEIYNDTLGMSIVTYTGNGVAGATIPHSLGAKPGLIVVRRTNTTGSWNVYHSSLGATKHLVLNTTAAAVTLSTIWNDTEPTDSLITLGNNNGLNGLNDTYVAYIFAPSDFIKIGSYTGNGNVDGPFINEMISPIWHVTKRTDVADHWILKDGVRSSYNPALSELVPDTNSAESNSAASAVDFLSVGTKLRTIHADKNASGGTYIYMMIGQPQGPKENTAR